MTAKPRPVPELSSSTLEASRLAALDSYGILDTPAEPGFDAVVQLACAICETPVALVSLVDRERQWFKARVGFPDCQTDLNSSVCRFALVAPDLLVIPDLTADLRTSRNPLVTDAPFIRFYAGAPLRTAEGEVLGSLCVIDSKPRPAGLTEAQSSHLRALAAQVMSQLELRRAVQARDGLLERQRADITEREQLERIRSAVDDSEGDLDAILNAVVAGAMVAVPAAEGGTFELIDGSELEYRAVSGTLASHQGQRVPLEGSTSGACARTRQPILLTDAQTDPRVERHIASVIRLGSAVHAPVMRGNTVLGVLKLQSSVPGAFSQDDLDRVVRFATAATAGVIEAREIAAQGEVHASETRYRAIFESAIDYAIIVLDLEGNVTNWNTGATAILGWEPADICGKPADVFFTLEDRAAGVPDREMRQAIAHGRGLDERWHIRKSGERFWASGEMMPLRDAQGDAIGFMKMLRDRTAQHLAGQALELAEKRLRSAQEAGGIGLFTVDIASNTLTPTPEFCRLYGLPVQEQYPASVFEECILPEDRELASSKASRASGEPLRDAEYRIRRPDTGDIRWIARKGDISFDDQGRPASFSGVSRDITEQRAVRDEMRGMSEQLRLAADATDLGVFDYDLEAGVLH